MKMNLIVFVFLNLLASATFGQLATSNVNIGDIFIIGEVEHDRYKHINFPKPNFIIKKGGIANFKSLKGRQVEVTAVKENKDGSIKATIKLSSDQLFFNTHKFVTVDINKAIEKGELISL